MVNQWRARWENTHGNISFYALAVLPVVLTLTVLVVDLSGWSALQDEAQREADRISFLAAQLLPDTGAAETLVSDELTKTPVFELKAHQFQSTSIDITLGATYDAVFDIFLEPLGKKQMFQVARSSVVQVVPTDYVLIINDGQTLRPLLAKQTPGLLASEPPWGNSVDWPASRYWQCTGYVPTVLNQPTWSDETKKRWGTEACFNPVLSPLKFAAMDLVDTLGAYRTNRVGLIFTPGDSSRRGYFIARHVRDKAEGNTVVGGFPVQTQASAQAYYPTYDDGPAPVTGDFPNVGNESCVLFSDPNWDQFYALPDTEPVLGMVHDIDPSCADPLPNYHCGDSHSPLHTFNTPDNCFISKSLTLRQTIYWNAAKLPYLRPDDPRFSSSGDPDIPHAISAAITELVNVVSGGAATGELAERGNTAYKALRKIIILTDSLPDPEISDWATKFDALKRANIQLIVLAFHHGYSYTSADNNLLSDRVRNLRSAAHDAFGDDTENRLQVLEAASPEELVNTVVPKFFIIGRQLVVKT